MTGATNPFPDDPARSAIWTMLVPRDIDAFMAADWSMVEGDFIGEGFVGIDANRSANPDDWTISFPTLDVYRDEWLRQAAATAAVSYAEDPRAVIYRATDLSRIDINGDIAVAHKRFDGSIRRLDGESDILLWRTLYFCRRMPTGWKLTGFVGYMPLESGMRA